MQHRDPQVEPVEDATRKAPRQTVITVVRDACVLRSRATPLPDVVIQLEAGGGLLSHDLAVAVPSALTGLTTVFGMGTGVALSR